jgi:hypothetical protein
MIKGVAGASTSDHCLTPKIDAYLAFMALGLSVRDVIYFTDRRLPLRDDVTGALDFFS